jgi:hypothetical protein
MRLIEMLLITALASGCVRTVVVAPVQNLAVRGFMAHADREWPGTAQQQAQTADTLDWLAAAIQSLATTKLPADSDRAKRIQEFRALIKEFSSGNPERTDQALVLRRTFATGAALIDDLVTAVELDRSARRRVSALRGVAESVDPGRPPRRQPDVVERYFHQASELLRRVDRGM